MTILEELESRVRVLTVSNHLEGVIYCIRDPEIRTSVYEAIGSTREEALQGLSDYVLLAAVGHRTCLLGRLPSVKVISSGTEEQHYVASMEVGFGTLY